MRKTTDWALLHFGDHHWCGNDSNHAPINEVSHSTTRLAIDFQLIVYVVVQQHGVHSSSPCDPTSSRFSFWIS